MPHTHFLHYHHLLYTDSVCTHSTPCLFCLLPSLAFPTTTAPHLPPPALHYHHTSPFYTTHLPAYLPCLPKQRSARLAPAHYRTARVTHHCARTHAYHYLTYTYLYLTYTTVPRPTPCLPFLPAPLPHLPLSMGSLFTSLARQRCDLPGDVPERRHFSITAIPPYPQHFASTRACRIPSRTFYTTLLQSRGGQHGRAGRTHAARAAERWAVLQHAVGFAYRGTLPLLRNATTLSP